MMHRAPSAGNRVSPGAGKATDWICGMISWPAGTGTRSFIKAMSFRHLSTQKPPDAKMKILEHSKMDNIHNSD